MGTSLTSAVLSLRGRLRRAVLLESASIGVGAGLVLFAAFVVLTRFVAAPDGAVSRAIAILAPLLLAIGTTVFRVLRRPLPLEWVGRFADRVAGERGAVHAAVTSLKDPAAHLGPHEDRIFTQALRDLGIALDRVKVGWFRSCRQVLVAASILIAALMIPDIPNSPAARRIARMELESRLMAGLSDSGEKILANRSGAGDEQLAQELRDLERSIAEASPEELRSAIDRVARDLSDEEKTIESLRELLSRLPETGDAERIRKALEEKLGGAGPGSGGVGAGRGGDSSASLEEGEDWRAEIRELSKRPSLDGDVRELLFDLGRAESDGDWDEAMENFLDWIDDRPLAENLDRATARVEAVRRSISAPGASAEASRIPLVRRGGSASGGDAAMGESGSPDSEGIKLQSFRYDARFEGVVRRYFSSHSPIR